MSVTRSLPAPDDNSSVVCARRIVSKEVAPVQQSNLQPRGVTRRRTNGAIVLFMTALVSYAAFAGLKATVTKAEQETAVFNRPTYSSPIAISADDKLVWVVNPDNDSVSVIRTDLDALVGTIAVGDEPQSIA